MTMAAEKSSSGTASATSAARRFHEPGVRRETRRIQVRRPVIDDGDAPAQERGQLRHGTRVRPAA